MPVEDPGRGAGPKVPDELGKSIEAGTAGHTEGERLTEIVPLQRPPIRALEAPESPKKKVVLEPTSPFTFEERRAPDGALGTPAGVAGIGSGVGTRGLQSRCPVHGHPEHRVQEIIHHRI